MKRYVTIFGFSLLAFAGLAQAQLTGTTSLSVVVGPEAALTVNTATTSLTAAGGTFSNPFTGTTSLTYFMRTSKTSGTGSLTVKITTDFAPAGGPLVATSGATGDALTFTCTMTGGTACATAQTASTTTAATFGTWGTAFSTPKAGDPASVGWSLVDDPAYAANTYTATATFTISAA